MGVETFLATVVLISFQFLTFLPPRAQIASFLKGFAEGFQHPDVFE